MNRHIIYLGRMIVQERKFVLFGIVQVIFSCFFMVFATAQTIYSKSILGNFFQNNEQNVYVFSKSYSGTIISEEMINVLTNWIDGKKNVCSFVSSIMTDGGTEMLVGIGDASSEFLGVKEMGKAYLCGSEMFTKNKYIRLKNSRTEQLFPIDNSAEVSGRVLIGKSVTELNGKIVLCMSYQEFYEIFGGYYQNEILRNLHLVTGEAEKLEKFVLDMESANISLVSINQRNYIDSYFGKMWKSGVLYAVFYGLVSVFVMISLYVNFLFVLRKNARMFTNQFLCGEQMKYIVLRGCILMLVILILAFIVCAWFFKEKFQFPEWQTAYRIEVIGGMIVYIVFMLRINSMFGVEQYEKYIKCERN